MSMNGWLLRLSVSQARALRTRPDLASELASYAAEQQLLSHLPPERRQALESRLVGLAGRSDGLRGLGTVGPALDLQKSWHILHYLLTGHAAPDGAPGDALLSGEPLGQDVGYGPPRLLDPAAVAGFNRFLAPLDLARLQARIDPAAMVREGVYGLPMGVDEAAGRADVAREAGWAFPALKTYVAGAATAGDALLTWLS